MQQMLEECRGAAGEAEKVPSHLHAGDLQQTLSLMCEGSDCYA